MSARVTIKTNMRSEEQIIQTLVAMGVPPQHVQHIPEGRQVKGYHGQYWGTAQVLISKAWHGGYGEVGFARQPDGTYNAVLDHIDNRSVCRRLQVEAPSGSSFAQLTGQWYAATTAKRTLQHQGFSAKIQQDGANLKVLAQQY